MIGPASEDCSMDNRQKAVLNRLSLIRSAKRAEWKEQAEQIADLFELNNPDLSSPRAFVTSLESKLTMLAREAVRRGMSPRDFEETINPVSLVENLLP